MRQFYCVVNYITLPLYEQYHFNPIRMKTTHHNPICDCYPISSMSDPIEESVIRELVSDEFMRCRACNVTAPNQPTWESHKKGKR